MKKIIMIVVAAFALCGAVIAQETNWPDFNLYDYENNSNIVVYIQIEGSFVGVADQFEQMEIAAFVGGVCRSHAFMKDETSLGDLYPTVQLHVYYDDPGESLSFQLYDHDSETLYGNCNVFRMDNPDQQLTLLTGEDHEEVWAGEDQIVINFTDFTKEISAYTENGGYYLIASPIGSVNPEEVGQMLTNNYDLYYFDQNEAKEWVNYKIGGEVNTNPGFSLEPGKGYLYANSENVTLTFSGAPYNINQPIPLTKTQGAQFEGWNLIGNPYATAATVSVESFYRMNPEGRADLIEGSDLVDAMEGIFVIAESDDDEVTFTPSTSSKSFEQIAINLLKNRGNVIDRAVVRFGECRQLPKFQLNPRNTKIYVTEGDKDYAVVRSAAEAEMPVSFRASENGPYTLAVEAENVEMNYLHLIDNLTGMDVDLLQTPNYTFQAKTTDYASRFKLVFAIDRTNDESFAFFNNDNWFINNDGKALLQVIDLNGRLLSNEQISGSVSKHIDAAPGVYVMRLINGDNVKTQKVVVR